ncbi:FAD-dependent oxidoreductase [Halobacterium wangiae]|uniref:FAD-dependent oxidoreductase n=1 Tax=Halobacterium wangiae TaxID=2902623 RepID=UPI001E31E2B8|nr:FAD-dependent oxidoreductase [Halobacterium wangiae]
MTHQTDVLVVGGGATGAGVARDLAMRGVDVTLVERGGLGSGTSGRSHGLLHSGARYADTDPEGAAECIAENQILRDVAGACVDATGGFFVQLPDDDPDYFEAKVAACRDAGVPVEVMDGEAARADEPGLSADAERVAEVPDGVVYPSRLVAATAADAREHGASVHTHAQVRSLLVDDGRVVGADVGGVGRVEADHVVNATGAWADSLAATAGVDLEVHPTKGAMVVVEYDGLDTVLNRCRPAADGDIVVPHADRVVLGTTSVEVGDPDEFPEDEAEVERVLAECAEMLPDVADHAVERAYWGVRPLYSPQSYGENARAISRGFYLLDHADRDGVAGFTTTVGGKLTTYRLMAEATADHVADRLGVDEPCRTADEPCRTADEPLVGHDDPDRLDELVAEFDAANPADADVGGD